MDHLNRNVHTGLAGDENDATPVCSLHLWQVMPAKPNAAHKVGLDDGTPIVVSDFLERLRLVYAKIIDKNVH